MYTVSSSSSEDEAPPTDVELEYGAVASTRAVRIEVAGVHGVGGDGDGASHAGASDSMGLRTRDSLSAAEGAIQGSAGSGGGGGGTDAEAGGSVGSAARGSPPAALASPHQLRRERSVAPDRRHDALWAHRPRDPPSHKRHWKWVRSFMVRFRV